MRIWFSGPGLFGGFIRPGISLDAKDLLGRRGASGNGSGAGGYCYVVRGDHGYVKIGSSVSPMRRLPELQTGSPFRLEIVNTVPVAYDAREIENAAHELLDRHRVLNEWFAVSPEIATAAIYAAADRVGRSIVGTGPDAAKRWIATPLGWIILIVIAMSLIGEFLR